MRVFDAMPRFSVMPIVVGIATVVAVAVMLFVLSMKDVLPALRPRPLVETRPAPDPEPPLPPYAPDYGPLKSDCPLTYRQRQYRDNIWVNSLLNFVQPPEQNRLVGPTHSVLLRNLSSVPDDFATNTAAPMPVLHTIADHHAQRDFITFDAALVVAGLGGVPVMGGAGIDVRTGMIIDRSNKAFGIGYAQGNFNHGSNTHSAARRIMSALVKGPRSDLIPLPTREDGYLWGVDWLFFTPGHTMDDTIQIFANHYDLWLTTGRNATIIMLKEGYGSNGIYLTWTEFFRQYWPVDVYWIPNDDKRIYRGNVTFGVMTDAGGKLSTAQFVSDVVAPGVLQACAERLHCEDTPTLWDVKDSNGGMPRGSAAVKTLEARDGLDQRQAMAMGMTQRVYRILTSEVDFANWGGTMVVNEYLHGGYTPRQRFPWRLRPTDSLVERVSKRVPDGCPVPRPPSRWIIVGSTGKYSDEVLIFGMQHALKAGSYTPFWYTLGEDFGQFAFAGAMVKMEWYGDGGEITSDAGSFDDAAFRFDDVTQAALDAVAAPESLREVNADDELYDHLLKTQRVMLMNRWIAQATQPAPATAVALSGTSRSGPPLRQLRPFPFLSVAPLFFAPRALSSTVVRGSSPSSRGVALVRRTVGLARYFTGGTSDAALQTFASEQRVNVTTVLADPLGNGGTVLVTEFGGAVTIAVPNSHPCVGILTEVELARPKDPLWCALFERRTASAWARAERDVPATSPPSGVGVWMMPSCDAADLTVGAAAQMVLSRLGHLILEDSLPNPEVGAFAVVHGAMQENVAKVVSELLGLFNITKLVFLSSAAKEVHALRWTSVRLLVPPQLEGFRMQFTAQQFAATRWLWSRQKTLSVDMGAPAILFCFNSVSDAAYSDDVRNITAAAADDPELAAVTVARDISPLSLMRALPAVKTLVVFFGDSLMYHVSMWANSLLRTPVPPTRTSSGLRAALHLIVLCPPAFHGRCRMGQDWGQTARYYGTGREFNLPRGISIMYYKLNEPRGNWAADVNSPQPIAQWIRRGFFRFTGLPRNHTEHGIDFPQAASDVQRLTNAFQAAVAGGSSPAPGPP